MTVDKSSSHVRSEVVNLIPALKSFARRFHRTPSDVDDLVQETLLRALANLDKFQPGTSLKSWLFTIMRNTFCTKFGLAKREVIGLGDGISAQPSVQAPQEWSVRARELEKAFSELPAHYRQALDIVLIQGESYEVAAQRCDCPLGTIKSRVNRARIHLAAQLGDNN